MNFFKKIQVLYMYHQKILGDKYDTAKKKRSQKGYYFGNKSRQAKRAAQENANSRKNIAKLQILKSLFAMSEKSSIDRLQKYIKKQIEKIEKSS